MVIPRKVKERSNLLQMAHTTKAILKMTQDMDAESLYYLMEISTLENGLMIRNKAMVKWILFPLVRFITGNGLMTRWMEWAL